MIRRLLIVVFAVALWAQAAGAYVVDVEGDTGLPDGVEQIDPIPLNPQSIEEMTAAASLVVRCRVDIVEPLDPDFEIRENSQRNYNTRIRMLAIVTVEEVYKGGFNSSTLSVEYLASTVNETPSLMELEPGERTILFLVPGPTPPHFAPVSYYSGKAPPYADLPDIKKAVISSIGEVTDEEALPEDHGDVAVNIRFTTGGSPSGGTAEVSIVVYNNTRREINLDTTLNPVKVFTVVGPDGEKISPSATFNPPLPNVTRLLPNHFTGARYDLSRYFKMSEPGMYKARASIMKPTAGAKGVPELIVSNTETFIVGE